MADALPTPNNECAVCADPSSVSVPGPTGPAGADGTNGTNGTNAFTTTSAAFTMPANQANVTVSVVESGWMSVGQVVHVSNCGYMEVQSKPTSTSVVLKNLEDTDAYTSNVAPGTGVAPANTIAPAGVQGISGDAGSVAVGGDLTGTAANAKITGLITTKGDLAVFSTTSARLAVGTNGQVLTADSAEAAGMAWKTQTPGATPVGGDLSGTVASAKITGLITTKGDIPVYTTTSARLPVGSNGQLLTADSTLAAGMGWKTHLYALRNTVSPDNGDADATLYHTTSDPIQLWSTALTVARAVTLSTMGAVEGAQFKIVRTGGGAFDLNVGTGPLKSLAEDTWCEVTYDGSAWFLSAYGAL